jgi:hypothetical protein
VERAVLKPFLLEVVCVKPVVYDTISRDVALDALIFHSGVPGQVAQRKSRSLLFSDDFGARSFWHCVNPRGDFLVGGAVAMNNLNES